jgi:hypothetical protein
VTADPAPLSDLLAAAERDALPDGWIGGEATREAGVRTRRFVTDDGERVVFYARGDGATTLARATWDDERGEYVVGPDLAERADAGTDAALFRAALRLMHGWRDPRDRPYSEMAGP